jgi:polyisoprenoid-binding protein YceI
MRNSKSGTILGKLTARGITRSETLAVTFDTSPASAAPGKSLNLSGEMTIDRRNYGMTAFQVIVGKKVKIRLKARIVPS